MRKTYTIIFAAALSLLCVSCAKGQFSERSVAPSDLDNMGVTSQVQALAKDANQLFVNITAPAAFTKAAAGDGSDAVDAEVEFVSYRKGSNPSMSSPLEDAMNGTKAVFDPITTTSLTANFLRIDQKVGESGLALDEWPTWNNAKVIEASTISNPDNAGNIHYRGVVFAPAQAYNIRVFGPEEARDTVFYHSRMVGFHPMVCPVPRSGELVSTIYFNNPIYAANLATVGGGHGVVFKNALDGRTDLMMSNCGDAQRWHLKTFGGKNIHYKATVKSADMIDYSYSMPFGHNDDPEYANPFFFKHYLSAVRIWAMVDQSGDGEQRAVNLQSWGQIQSISVLEQPSTVTVSIPDEPTTAIVMESDGSGRIRHEEDGSVMVNKSSLVFGASSNWTDFTNMPICGEKFYGETDVNHPDAEETTIYPVDMTKYANSAKMEMTYLGYFLVKPCGSDDEIILAIRTAGGIYRAKIPALYRHEDESTENIFKEGNVYDVVLNLRTAGTFTEFIENEDESEYENLSPYDNLNGTYKCSNSYIIDYSKVLEKQASGNAGYCFIASMMGNGPDGVFSDGNTSFPTADASIKGIATAKLIWSSSPDLISNVQLQHSYIRFYVDHAQIGNALIAVLDSNGNILWSWHIWITDVPDDIVVNGVKYMDRNLGATFNPKNHAIPNNDTELCNSYGLYYQWGRKDPLPVPITNNISSSDDNAGSSLITPLYDASGKEILELAGDDREGSIENSIKSPDKMFFATNSPYYDNDWISVPNNILWGKEVDGKPAKSIYDPCPFGYRVPANEIQRLFSGVNEVTEIEAGTRKYGLRIAGSLYFPYAGYIGDERSFSGHNATYRYVGRKGDYQSSLICPSADANAYSWYTNHRLRTYLSATTSWTENGIDAGSVTFNAPYHYVVTSTDSHRDYTNRSTGASVRCVRDESYARAGETSLSVNKRYLESNQDVKLSFRAEINQGVFSECRLVLTPNSGAPKEINLLESSPAGVEKSTWDATHRIGTYSFNTGALGSISKYNFSLVMRDDAGNTYNSAASMGLNYAKIYVYPNASATPAAGQPKRFVTVDNNLTGTSDPVVGQPTHLTAYVSDELAKAGNTSVSSVIGTYEASERTRQIIFEKVFPEETITIDGYTYQKWTAGWNSEDYMPNPFNFDASNPKTSSGKKIRVTLTLTYADGSTGSTSDDISLWAINYGSQDRSFNANTPYAIQCNARLSGNKQIVTAPTTVADPIPMYVNDYPTFYSLFAFTRSRSYDRLGVQNKSTAIYSVAYTYGGTTYYLYSTDSSDPYLSTSSKDWWAHYLSALDYFHFLYNDNFPALSQPALRINDSYHLVRTGSGYDDTNTKFYFYPISYAKPN